MRFSLADRIINTYNETNRKSLKLFVNKSRDYFKIFKTQQTTAYKKSMFLLNSYERTMKKHERNTTQSFGVLNDKYRFFKTDSHFFKANATINGECSKCQNRTLSGFHKDKRKKYTSKPRLINFITYKTIKQKDTIDNTLFNSRTKTTSNTLKQMIIDPPKRNKSINYKNEQFATEALKEFEIIKCRNSGSKFRETISKNQFLSHLNRFGDLGSLSLSITNQLFLGTQKIDFQMYNRFLHFCLLSSKDKQYELCFRIMDMMNKRKITCQALYNFLTTENVFLILDDIISIFNFITLNHNLDENKSSLIEIVNKEIKPKSMKFFKFSPIKPCEPSTEPNNLNNPYSESEEVKQTTFLSKVDLLKQALKIIITKSKNSNSNEEDSCSFKDFLNNVIFNFNGYPILLVVISYLCFGETITNSFCSMIGKAPVTINVSLELGIRLVPAIPAKIKLPKDLDKITNKELNDILVSKEKYFSSRDIKIIINSFTKIYLENPSDQYIIFEDSFCNNSEMFFGISSKKLGKAMFNGIDKNKSYFITFNEYVEAISLLLTKYPGKDSWRLMFALYDYNNDKKITLSDLAEICEEIKRLNNEKIKIEFQTFDDYLCQEVISKGPTRAFPIMYGKFMILTSRKYAFGEFIKANLLKSFNL